MKMLKGALMRKHHQKTNPPDISGISFVLLKLYWGKNEGVINRNCHRLFTINTDTVSVC